MARSTVTGPFERTESERVSIDSTSEHGSGYVKWMFIGFGVKDRKLGRIESI